jgi:peroxin-19
MDEKELDDLLESALQDFEEIENQQPTKASQRIEINPEDLDKSFSSIGTLAKKSSDINSNNNNNNSSSDTVDGRNGRSTSTSKSFIEQENINETTSGQDGVLDEVTRLMTSLSSRNEEDFNKTLEDIMNAFQQNGEEATNKELEKAAEETIDKLLGSFEEQPGMQKVMEEMMSRLVSKEVLYEPMKLMKDKYPGWLEENRNRLSKEDYDRYGRQFECMRLICSAYESDIDPSQRVVTLMQEMQETGQPPVELLKEVAPDLELNSEGNPIVPGMEDGQNCVII